MVLKPYFSWENLRPLRAFFQAPISGPPKAAHDRSLWAQVLLTRKNSAVGTSVRALEDINKANLIDIDRAL